MTHKIPVTDRLMVQYRIEEIRKALNSIEKAVQNDMSKEVFEGAFIESNIRKAWACLHTVEIDILLQEEVWKDCK